MSVTIHRIQTDDNHFSDCLIALGIPKSKVHDVQHMQQELRKRIDNSAF